MKELGIFRIYYEIYDDCQDIYLQGHSAQEVVDHIRKDEPDAVIIEVAKVVKGWK